MAASFVYLAFVSLLKLLTRRGRRVDVKDVERLHEQRDALHHAIAESIDRIEKVLPAGWRDHCHAADVLVLDEARDTLRAGRGPVDEAIRDAERVMHLLDDLDRDLLGCA